MANANKPPKHPQDSYNSARGNLLLVIAFSLINMVLALIESGTYFLFSASAPMAMLDLAVLGSWPMGFAVVVAVIILGLYFLCWFLSKNKSTWMTIATVLFALDIVVLLTVYDLEAMIIDVIFHGWVMYSLVSGCIAAAKLKKMAAQPPVAPVQPAPNYVPAPTFPTPAADNVAQPAAQTPNYVPAPTFPTPAADNVAQPAAQTPNYVPAPTFPAANNGENATDGQ